MDIYKPREDSILILKEIRPYAIGNVLDIGTGPGLLAIEASRTADHVYAIDINKEAKNIMCSPPFFVQEDKAHIKFAEILEKHKINSVPVVDKKNKLLSIQKVIVY